MMLGVVDLLNRAGELWWRYALHAAWQASLLALVVLIVVRLGRRWPAPLRYWVLVVALLKFAVPPLLSVPTGMFSWIGPRVAPMNEDAARTEPGLTSAEPGAERTDVAVEPGDSARDDVLVEVPGGPDSEIAFDPSPIVAETSPRDEAPGPSRPTVAALEAPPVAEKTARPIGWRAWLLAAHALGFLGVAVWTLWQVVVLRRVVARARAVHSGAVYERVLRLWHSISKRRPPRLLVSTEPVAPMVFGVWRPAVVVPSSAVEGLPSDQLDTMLAHELAHVRRHDTWVNWLQIALAAVWWFNPVVWVLNRAVRKAREDCCDDLVLHRGETSNDAYCETLLHAASRLAVSQPVGARLGFADRLHPLGARMKRIMDTTLRRAPALTLGGVVLVAFLAVVLLPGLGCRRSKEEKPEEAKQTGQWQALVDEQNKLIEDYKAQLERLQEDTGAAKVLAEQAVYWERKVADAEAELLGAKLEFGEAHPEVKKQLAVIELYKQKLEEARKQAAAVTTGGPLIGPIEPGSRPELNGALLTAAREGNLAGVKSLLERGAFIDTVDRENGNRTPLHWALINRHEAVAVWLIEHGAGANVHDGQGNTPLHWAAHAGHAKAVELLVAKGAELEAKDLSGDTPLFDAIVAGHADVARLLLEKGARLNPDDPAARNLLGRVVSPDLVPRTPEAQAAQLECAKLLLEKGFDPNMPTPWGGTPLLTATTCGRADMLRLLFEHGATVEAASGGNADLAPLFAALGSGSLETVQLLLEKGADPNVSSSAGRRPLHIALTHRPPETGPQMPPESPLAESSADEFIPRAVKLLIEHGADVNAKDNNGYTPLHYALEKRLSGVAEILIAAGADIETAAKRDQTPLWQAVNAGDSESVRVLLDAGAEANDGRPLGIAVYKADKEIVRLLLDHGADPNRRSEYGTTLLQDAAKAGNAEIAKLLLDAGAEVNARDREGRTALFVAASAGQEAVAKLLLERGADPSLGGPYGTVPLHEAVNWRRDRVVQLLISKGADIETRDGEGRTPLALAVSAANLEITKILLAAHADADTNDRSNRTPLGEAAQKGHKEIVDALLAAGADPNLPSMPSTSPYARTAPLLLAMRQGAIRPEIVAALLAKGADVNVKDGDGNTPLHKAVEYRAEEQVKLFLASGADVNAANKKGFTPLHWAMSTDDETIGKMLLDAGAAIDAKDEKGWTPLHYAAVSRETQEAEFLLGAGANIEAVDTSGETPLSLAAGEGRTEAVKLLLGKGAKVDAKDKEGRTPLMVAAGAAGRRPPALDVCTALVDAGADVNARDNKDTTPLHFAARSGDEEIVRFLLDKGADPTAKSNNGKTPADFAGSDSIRQLLLDAAAGGAGRDDAGAARENGVTDPPPPAAQPRRSWGPEQATGEPDTRSAGDMVTAWASRTADGQDEWLELEYAEAVTPTAVKVYETYNPGALSKVSVFDAEGKEHVVWEGDDPTPSTTSMGVSEIKFTTEIEAKRVKLYLKSKEVKGWNEIDAVGLVDNEGKAHWAVLAVASSTYAADASNPSDGAGAATREPPKDVSYADDLAAFIKEVDEQYPFFELKGIKADWEGTKKELVEEVKGCKSDTEFLGLVLKAVRCLRDAQMGVRAEGIEFPPAPARFYSGISFLPATDKRVVVMFAPAGHEAALKTAMVVTKIDGQDARTVLEARAKAAWDAGGYFSSPQRARLFEYRIALRGEQGEKHTITFLDGDKEREVTLTSNVEARGWPHVYNMPPNLVQAGRGCAYTKLEGGAGYIYLRYVDSTTAGAVGKALEAHPDAKGWIIDLRGNGGGGYDNALIEQLRAIPRPVAVLIDAGTMGAGETLARDVLAATAGRSFGSPTAGSSTAKRTWAFPSGKATVTMSTRSRWRSDGKPIEFNGIEPDVEVEAVPEELQKGQNSTICRAEEYVAGKETSDTPAGLSHDEADLLRRMQTADVLNTLAAIRLLEGIGGDASVRVLMGFTTPWRGSGPVGDWRLVEAADKAIVSILRSGHLKTDLALFIEAPPQFNGQTLDFDYSTTRGDKAIATTLHVQAEPIVNAEDVRSLRMETRRDGKPLVICRLEDHAAERFARATRDNIERRMAFVVGGHVVSAPTIKAELTGSEVPILVDADEKELKRLFPDLAEDEERSKVEATLRFEGSELVFELKNTGEKPKVFCFQRTGDLYYQLYFDVVAPSGVRYAYHPHIMGNVGTRPKLTHDKDDFVTLAPGESFTWRLSGFPSYLNDPRRPRPGRYELAVRYVSYDMGRDVGLDAWIGLVQTPHVAVMLPLDDEPREDEEGT